MLKTSGMKRISRVFCLILILSVVVGCVPAFAKIGNQYVSTVSGLRVHAAPNGSSEILFKLEKGEFVKHIGSQKNWWMVMNKQGEQGYVFNSFLEAGDPQYKQGNTYLTRKKVALRKKPTSSSYCKKVLRAGTFVTIESMTQDFAYVTLQNGATGWVAISYLKVYD